MQGAFDVRELTASGLASDAGHSKGGDTVVTYAGKYDDVPKVVNVSGRFHLDQGVNSLRASLDWALAHSQHICCCLHSVSTYPRVLI